MKLPEPTWLSLPEAIEWLLDNVDELGEDPEKIIKIRLARAFRQGEVGTQVFSPGFYNVSKSLILPFDWEEAKINWQESEISSRNDIGFGRETETYGVEVNRDDLIAWVQQTAINKASTPQTAGGHSGETSAYRSPYVKLMLAAEENFGSRLDSSGSYAKKHEVEEWLRKNWSKYVSAQMSKNLIKSMATLIRNPELGKGGTKRDN
jgi:hypothetical protein